MWSEVLDADAFAAFQETGDIFDRATAKRLRDCIYAAGGRQDSAEAYKSFRGRLPTPDALLRKRGFAAGEAVVASIKAKSLGFSMPRPPHGAGRAPPLRRVEARRGRL